MYKKRTEIFDANFVYFILISCFIGIRIISSSFSISQEMGYVLNAIIQIALMFCLPVFLFSYLTKQKVKSTLSNYGFKKLSVKAIVYSVLIGVLIYIMTVCVSSFFSLIISALGYDPSYGAVSQAMTEYPLYLLLINLLGTAVLPGICEEVAHRGMLVNAYKPLGMKKAILISGLLFGLMHLNIEQFFYATLIGFLLGFIVIITDNIFPVIIMHFMNNAISTYLGFSAVNKLPLGTWFYNIQSSVSNINPISAFLMIFLFITIILLLLAFFVFMLFKETRFKRMKSLADQIIKKQLRNELMQSMEIDVEAQQLPSNVLVDKISSGNKEIYKINFLNQLSTFTPKYKPTLKDNVFLIVNLFMGVAITVCTLVWGIV